MNIVCVASSPWKGNYASSTVALMKILGRDNHVLYVENPQTYAAAVQQLRKARLRRFFSALFSKGKLEKYAETEKGSIHVLHLPLVIPHNFLPEGGLYRTIAALAGRKIKKAIDRTTRQLGMQEDLINVTAFNPALTLSTGPLQGQRSLVYYCYDNIHAAQWLKKHGAPLEQKFARLSDRIIVSSAPLTDKFRNMEEKVCLVKNGADTELFRKALNTDRTAEKTVGFIGSLDDRVNYSLLKELAARCPDWKFLFAGRVVVQEALELEKSSANIRFLGPMPLEDLVPVVKTFTVGIIPFELNEFTRAIYPLKINEYLAAGIPVITTPFADLSDFDEVVDTASDVDGFIACLQKALNEDTEKESRRRMEFARNNSWEERSKIFSNCLQTAHT